MSRLPVSRRDFVKLSAAGVLGSSASWLPAFASDAASNGQRKRSCILLWMSGGPATIDLFDLKVGHVNGGPFKEIATAAPGLKFGEHLPKLAKHGKEIAVVRSMSTKEGDHGRATYFMRTGNLPTGAIQFPTIGSLVSKELGDPRAELPNFVSVSPFRLFAQGAFGPGFLGPQYAPLVVGDNNNFGPPRPNQNVDDALKVQDLNRPADITTQQADARFEFLKDLERGFASERPNLVAQSHQTAYDRAVRLMQSVGAKAFDLTTEPEKLRDSYGRNLFGQGCLLARRLVERGVPFIEVNLGGWDTHQNNHDMVKRQCEILDPAWATMMADLKDRGLLETTTIVWMGEFGRTPKINQGKGRDHFPNAWAAVLAGGGVKGGRVYGKTSPDAQTVEGEPTTTPDFLATLCKALGIDHKKQNPSNVGRPIRIVDKSARVIDELV
jgi:hypothetical protein